MESLTCRLLESEHVTAHVANGVLHLSGTVSALAYSPRCPGTVSDAISAITGAGSCRGLMLVLQSVILLRNDTLRII